MYISLLFLNFCRYKLFIPFFSFSFASIVLANSVINASCRDFADGECTVIDLTPRSKPLAPTSPEADHEKCIYNTKCRVYYIKKINKSSAN